MHFQRQKLMAVTEYIAPRPAVPPRCLPRGREEAREEVTSRRGAAAGPLCPRGATRVLCSEGLTRGLQQRPPGQPRPGFAGRRRALRVPTTPRHRAGRHWEMPQALETG